MQTVHDPLELKILDVSPPGVGELCCCWMGRVKDPATEHLLVGGRGALLCYDPMTGERESVVEGIQCGVGLTSADVNHDGLEEIFVSTVGDSGFTILMFVYDGQRWHAQTVDANLPGHAHDIVLADVDGDGQLEIVTNSCYAPRSGLFLLRSTGHDGKLPTRWQRHAVSTGVFTEGISVGDLNGDGKMEIVSGPDWYEPPAAGPYSDSWVRRTYATSYREMCRTGLVDITGNGRPDIVITDSEYMDGTLSWFENRLGEAGPDWIEHRLNDRVVYSHSLEVNPRPGGVDIFVAEMEEGGWQAPYNHDARLLLYATRDQGRTWTERTLYQGEGTHQATLRYQDGDVAVFGKTLGRTWHNPRVQVFTPEGALDTLSFHHRLIDRDKPGPGTDILTFRPEETAGPTWIACGRWVYRPCTTGSGYERFTVSETSQILTAYDLDGDGRDELIVTYSLNDKGEVETFSNQLYWKKLLGQDENGLIWKTGRIGAGHGDWPHGSLVAPVLPEGKPALLTAYHSAHAGGGHVPQLYPVPLTFGSDLDASTLWDCRILADVCYGEEMIAADITSNGRLDVVAGNHWLRNNGDGSFTPFTIVPDFAAARVALADITGNGRLDVILVEEAVDYMKRVASFVRFAWCECPADPQAEPWILHSIDSLRSPHSLSCGDIDGDGIVEFIVAEHDPFWPYRKRNRLFVYKTLDQGRTWRRRTMDSRFEHHDGAKRVDLGQGKQGILSHGWKDSKYVHLWEIA